VLRFLSILSQEHLLGQFCGLCEQRLGTGREVLPHAVIQELKDLTEFGNRFHHDTNSTWQTATVNDGELTGFVQRTLDFARA
jgi:hypothetical protein